MKFSDADYENASNLAKQLLQHSNIDFTDLTPTNIDKINDFLKSVYIKWKNNEIDDLTAYNIAGFLESEPIHHLLSISIYPLADLWYYVVEKGDLEIVAELKDKVNY